MPKVIVIGSSNLDLTIIADRLPMIGETLLGRDFSQSVGGKGANQAVAARRAGAEVVFFTKLGADSNGRLIKQCLLSEGLPEVGLLRHPTSQTGVALILVDREGRNMIAVAPGSNYTLTLEEIHRMSPYMMEGDVLLLQLETPLPIVTEALSLAKARGTFTILNPAPARPLSSDVLKLVDVLTPNEGEARAMTGLQPDAASRVLLEHGIGSVVVTLGERGALLATPTTTRLFKAFPVTPVDSTAAGDAFNGVLACRLAEGQPLEDAVRFANAAGALATTKRGAQDALPCRRDIELLASG
jgi:ribokinase